jgi:DNA-binding MarR family transcriptional regulator
LFRGFSDPFGPDRVDADEVCFTMTEDRCGSDFAHERDELLSALIVDTVFARQMLGETTHLRDLHRLLDISQPTALRLVRTLEQTGSVAIESDTYDALASPVTVQPALASQLARARRRMKL